MFLWRDRCQTRGNNSSRLSVSTFSLCGVSTAEEEEEEEEVVVFVNGQR